MLQSEKLLQDPRIEQAKKLLQDALADHNKSIDQVRDPKPELKEKYAETLARLEVARGGAPYFPYLTSGIGSGPYVELLDGSVKMDFIVGIGVHGLGHSHPSLLNASVDAALEDTIMQGNLQQDYYSLLLCERLLKHAQKTGADLQHCLLTTSGAMANENALKIAFHNRTPASRVICIEHCFAGRSMVLAQLTDKAIYRTGLPTVVDVDYIPMFHPSDPEGTTKRAIETLKAHLERYPGQHACIWMELVAGEGGYYPGTKEYFEEICKICKAHNILVAFDEIQTFGRLSRPFAFQHFELDQYVDIVSLGKITQVCATLYGTKLKPKGPLLSQTFTGATASIRAGLAVLDTLEQEKCFVDDAGNGSRNVERHEYFKGRLEALASKYPGKLTGPYGEGMMIAFTPGDGSAETAKNVLQKLYDLGLMGFLAGSDPNRIRFLPPPGITTEAHIDAACEIIEKAIQVA